MKKGDIIEGKIEKYSFPNRGSFLHIEENPQAEGGQIERNVTVKGALPGQTVKVRIKKKKEGKAEGILLDVVKSSSLETKKPMCNHFYSCGGCTYQTFAYTSQLKLKEQMVKDVLSQVLWPELGADEMQLQPRGQLPIRHPSCGKEFRHHLASLDIGTKWNLHLETLKRTVL